MCGIAGYLHDDKNRDANQLVLKAMTDVVAHRGPDGEGFHLSGPLALGHRRLSIIDLAGGDQPMYSPDRSIVLIFNGEIYNYIELRDELKGLGHTFRTECDTEVVIEAYRRWGTDCQNKFNGMWAFAIWDDQKKALFLSRDRMGEKPLHYAQHDNTFLFSSEIKSLFAYGLPRVPDPDWVEVYTCLSFMPSPHSFFKGVHKLAPGHFIWLQDGKLTNRAYWDLPEIDESDMLRDIAQVERDFEALFDNSVNIRMRSDVPFGAFLSGGLDSSCIVASMASVSSHPVKTFTIGFDQPEYDERDLARIVAEHFKTEHHEQVIKPDVFEESIARVLHHYDEPFGDSSAIPTGYVSRNARRDVKMVLTGDGGDEALSGYTIYQGEKFAAKYNRLPSAAQSIFAQAAAGTASLFRGKPRYKLNRVRNVLRSAALPFEQRLTEKVSWADSSLIKSIFDGQPNRIKIEEYISDIMGRCPYKDPFYRLMHYNLKYSLPDKMLVKVDRMSMAHSLEVRTPFLDYRLIELMVKTHKDVKMRKMERKSVLRNTVAKRLPPALMNAPKKGFAVPIGEWFKGQGLSDQADNLLQPGGIGLNGKVMRDIVEQNNAGTENYGNLIWILTVLDRIVRK